VQRQTALKQQRENAAAPRAAEAFSCEPTELGAQFILGDRQGADFNAYNTGRAGIAANGSPDDSRFNAVIAEHGINAAPVGQQRAEAAAQKRRQETVTGETAREFNKKPTETLDANGNIVFAPQEDFNESQQRRAPDSDPGATAGLADAAWHARRSGRVGR
jgi:hypothetical protein